MTQFFFQEKPTLYDLFSHVAKLVNITGDNKLKKETMTDNWWGSYLNDSRQKKMKLWKTLFLYHERMFDAIDYAAAYVKICRQTEKWSMGYE